MLFMAILAIPIKYKSELYPKVQTIRLDDGSYFYCYVVANYSNIKL